MVPRFTLLARLRAPGLVRLGRPGPTAGRRTTGRACSTAPAWTLDDATGQYYLHNFLAEQPDLNWWNEDVPDAFDDILRFWFDRGVAGFRIDVAHMIVKDRDLRKPWGVDGGGGRNQPEVHDVYRRWRRLAERGSRRGSCSERRTSATSRSNGDFYGAGEDELHLAFNFPSVYAHSMPPSSRRSSRTPRLPPRRRVAGLDRVEPRRRAASRPAGRGRRRAHPRRARCAAHASRHARPLLRRRDRMTEVDVAPEQLRDPVGLRRWPTTRAGTHAHADAVVRATGPGSPSGRAAWLPLGDHAGNVDDQRDEPTLR